MQYAAILMGLSAGASASIIGTSAASSSATPTSSSVTLPTPTYTGDVSSPKWYSKYARLHKDADPKVMSCYISVKMDDPECTDSRSSRIATWDPETGACVPEGNPDVIPESEEKPGVGTVCDQKYELAYFYFTHKWRGMDSGSGQVIFGESDGNIDDGKPIPLGLQPGCWAGYQDNAWFGNCAADFVVGVPPKA